MDEGEEAGSEFIIANGDPTELLEFEKERFHKMTFLVMVPINIPGISLTISGRDAKIRVMIGNKFTQSPFAVCLIRKDSGSFQVNSTEQFFSDGDIMDVAGSQQDFNRVTQCVHDGVNLSTSAASTDTNALIGLRFVLADSLLLAGVFLTLYGF